MGAFTDKVQRSQTTMYVGEVLHPLFEEVHVLGYQCVATGQKPGPKAMVIHFPTDKRMTKDNIIDTNGCPHVLSDMLAACKRHGASSEPPRESGREEVEVFEHGVYHIAMLTSPKQVHDALEQVPPEKRPPFNPELFEWFDERQRGYQLAVVCFQDHGAGKPTPLWWWYRPKFADVLMAPGISATDGTAPRTSSTVNLDHTVMFGSYRLTEQTPGVVRVTYREPVTHAMERWRPNLILGRTFQGRASENQDFLIHKSDLRRGNLAVYRGLLPAVA